MANMTTSKRLRVRVAMVAAIIVAFFIIVAAHLTKIMIIEGDFYKNKAEQNQLQDKEIPATRGVIYDANGEILAQSADVWKIYINAKAIPDDDGVREFVSRKLSSVLDDIDYETVLEKTKQSEQSYVVVKSQVEFEEKERVAEILNEKTNYYKVVETSDGTSTTQKSFSVRTAVGIDDDVKRYYPQGSLASSVIGFTGSDGEGRGGIELQYNELLAGVPGRLITAKNGRSDTMSNEYETIYSAQDGAGVVLTIDSTIQRYLEEELEGVYETSQGAGAYGVVMNVKTGGILAMACVPGFDCNNPYGLTEKQKEELEKIEDEEEKNTQKSSYYFHNWRNFLVSDTYEPGSVFKIVTASAGLESGKIDESYSYSCYGSIQVADQIIKCHNHKGHGFQDLRQGLMNSCNPFFITVGQKLGKETFFRYFEAFGFTERTGIDLPAEATPVEGKTYHSYADMSFVDLSSSAFGQTFQVTPIQIITAISTIANGGNLLTPYVVAKTIDKDGNVLSETKPVIRRQVISKQTADIVTSMMEDVVSGGTGKNAYVAGYHVAGKTGTSQKLSEGSGHYVASFGCFAPTYDPEIAVLVLVDEPVGSINGGQICTPVAARIIKNTLTYMNVEPQYSDEERAKMDTPALNYIGSNVSDAVKKLEADGYTVNVVGTGDVVTSQMPAYGTIIPKNGYVVLYTGTIEERQKTTVPDFTGYTVYDVQAVARSVGLNASVSGNSSVSYRELVAYDQSIAPGQEVEMGSTITIYFKSNSGVTDF